MGRHGGTRSRRFRSAPSQAHRPVRLTEAQAQQRIDRLTPEQKPGAVRRFVNWLRKLAWWRRAGTPRPAARDPKDRLTAEQWIAKCKSRAERRARRDHLQHVRRKNGKW